jgi:hypothetical protein
VRKRKVALRLGELADRKRWLIRAEPAKRLLNGSLQLGELSENDVNYDVQQKGVDIKMSLGLRTRWPRMPPAEITPSSA